MKDFNDVQVIDFILNDSFVQWASGALTVDEAYWLNYITVHPHKTEVFNQAKEIVLHLQIQPVRNLSHQEVDQLIKKVLQKNNLPGYPSASGNIKSLKWYNNNFFRIAAIALITITALTGVFLATLSTFFKWKPETATISKHLILRANETSGPIWVRLPDKTSVILKPGSQLRYPNIFAQSKREVYLTGEAFFEVTKNPQKPFFVYANEMTTRVLGTSFTIKAFKGDKNFKVIVNTGKVAVFANTGVTTAVNDKTSVLVIPNQQAIFYRKEALLIKNDLKKPLMLSEEVSKTLFNFNETPFSKVVDAIGKAYGINITYNEKNLANCPLTASLTDQPLYVKLDLICKAVEAHYVVNEGEIYIDGKGCQTN